MTDKPMSDNEQWRRLRELTDTDLKDLAAGASGLFGGKDGGQPESEQKPVIETDEQRRDEASRFQFEEVASTNGDSMRDILDELRAMRAMMEEMVGG